jgi:hypothetical protein
MQGDHLLLQPRDRRLHNADVGEQLLHLHNTQRRRDIKCERRIHQQQRPHSAARWGIGGIDRQRYRATCIHMYIGGEVGHVGEGDDGR